jgi:hypothetical protein
MINLVNIDADIIMFEGANKSWGQFWHYPEVDFNTPVKKEMDSFVKKNDLDPALIEHNCNPLDIQVAYDSVDTRMKEIKDFFGDVKYQSFLTGRGNYRYKIATIQGYKANRWGKPKPPHLQEVRDYLIKEHGALETQGQEADDAIGIAQNKTSVCVSTDKDFNCFPGLHAMWTTPWNKTFKTWGVSELDALRFFYKQLLTGDSGDNILGLFGIGKTSVYIKRIDSLETEEEMFDLVYALYKQRFGNYAEPFLLETGRLLWIRQEEGQMWEFPV